MGSAGFCVNHPGRPADIRCIQCHNPLCADCVIHDEGDPFCSKKCISRYRTFHRSYEAEHARTPVVTVVLRVVVVLLILLILRLVIAALAGVGWGPMQAINDFIRSLPVIP